MKYSILGFNQAKLIELQKESGGKILKLDMTDVMLLEYIQFALSRPSMKHKTDDNNQPYVWISHKKILEDLPILDIKDNMLKKRLNKLTELGLIKSMVFANENCRGSRAYYKITELCESLICTQDYKEGMTLNDMIEIYRGKDTVQILVEIRDKEGYKVCITDISSKGVLPYKQVKIIEWFIKEYANCEQPKFVIYLDI